jgi:hypothetical protein
MSAAWQKYQDAAAVTFRRMGLTAEVDKDVAGVRAVHAIDVYVTGTFHGLDIKWIVECKAWKSNVPKEKVLALLSIVQDIGADKGILLSEIGFQSGAILLTSIGDLSDQLASDFKEYVLKNLSWRLKRVTDRLHALDSDAEDYVWTPQLEQQFKLFALDMAFREALDDRFPLVYAVGKGEQRLSAADFDDFVKRADDLLRDAEDHCDRTEKAANQPAGPASTA